MNRIEKFQEFNKFADNADSTFSTLRNASESAQAFDSSHTFYAMKGGAMGGVDKRIVEVFFGSRPFDDVEMFLPEGSGLPGRRTKTLTERGARLMYERTDAGTVICTLRPAFTNDLQALEDAIALDWIRDPSVLNGNRRVRKHWRAFISYMECTCIDGTPTIIDRARVGWLRFSKHLIKDGRQSSKRINVAILDVVKFSLTIGLSGFLIALLGLLSSTNEASRTAAERDNLVLKVGEARGEITSDRQRISALEGQVETSRDRLSQANASIEALKLEEAKKGHGTFAEAKTLPTGTHAHPR